MRWSPGENNDHQQPGVAVKVIGYRRPTQQWRHGTGKATYHDILGVARFK